MFGIGIQEMIIIGAIGVLLFGKRLPEVGRAVGKSLMEFKRGMQGIESEIQGARQAVDYAATPSTSYEEMADDYPEPAVPKFEPPAGPPTEESPNLNS
jgi:sec-independent protein translocase protein TatA